jgi:2-polyprenyl-3-methyl-5-hydroxy-6-metoxy-1,4-benzoquinol methylase
MSRFRPGTSGSGPGEFGVDGSPVQAYAVLPPDVYAACLVHAAVPAGANVLELGCGTGRVTHPLLKLGHPVVAVDGSPAMLAHVHGARTVCAGIEELDLGERFDVVLLMSYLVEYGQREQLLHACRRHVNIGGTVILQRLPPHVFETLSTFEHRTKDMYHRVNTARPAPDLLTITLEHRLGDQAWTHTATSRQLSDQELPHVLAAAGLRFSRFLDTDGWILATPV